MNPVDYVIIGIVVIILGLAVLYIRWSKKKGNKCIGCPAGGNCSGGCAGCACSKENRK
jgi:hypothetical protein